MIKRTFIKEEPVFQFIHRWKKKGGKIFAHKLHGENTIVHFQEKLQGLRSYRNFEVIIFSITFCDFEHTHSSKYSVNHPTEGMYVKYALDLLEENSLEEYYKTALLLTKKTIENSIQSFEKSKLLRKKKGYWEYPINHSPKNYICANALYKKILKTIDVEMSDLRYFEPYYKS